MKDICEIANEARENGRSEKEVTELFAEGLLTELKKLKGTDISPYLSCKFDVVHRNYIIKLTIPTTANIFNAITGNDE